MARPQPNQGQAPASGTPPATAGTSRFRSADDGWFDLGGFLDLKFGFMPIASVITEPAIGLGAFAGVAFINKPLAGDERPDITLVGGLGTENGTKGAMAGDVHHWFGGRLQTLASMFWVSANLDYYGLGDDSALASDPLRYNLEPAGALVQAKYRLGESPLFVGLRYVYARTHVAFDASDGAAGQPEVRPTSKVSGVGPSLTLDSRDNIFTPTRGSYVEGIASFFGQALGGDDDFERLEIVGMHYAPLPARIFLGVRGEVATSSDDTPFYLRPFIYQRGVAAMRYQGEQMAQIEGELRWQFWKRLSLVGFGGTGAAWTGFDRIERPRTAAAGGGGFRYELARRHGLHAGFDLAAGPDGAAFYIQFGSAWARP